jgi:two-component system, NarL family, nitrate/nitrite response regulator NarL
MDNHLNLLVLGESRFFNEAIGDMVKAQHHPTTIETSTPDTLLKTSRSCACDLILIDAKIRFPPLVEVIRNVRTLWAEPKIIILGADQDDLLEIIEAGAHGYVLKDQPFAEVIETIEAVQRGQARCSSQIAISVFNRVSALSRVRAETNGRLTPREQEILESIAAGLSNKDISRQLRITLCTVKNHVHNILTKLQVHRRQDAIQYRMIRENPKAAVSR